MVGSDKIKLVQIIADSESGGGANHVLNLLKFVDKKIFDCYLICPPGNLAREARDIHDVEVIDIEMHSKFDLSAIRRISAVINQIRSKYDPFGPIIVHTHGPRAGLLGRWAIPDGIYSVYTEHIWTGDYHLENRIGEWLQLRWLRKLNHRTDLIIGVSGAVKDFLAVAKLAPQERTLAIPNGIDIKNIKVDRKKIKAARDRFIIGNVGNLLHTKGQIYLIEAMPQIIKAYPHAMLEIVGEGSERKVLEAKIAELHLERHVTLLGRQLEVYKFMSRWRVFVSASLSETFGIAVLEAMAAGLPVVATHVGGMPEIIKNGKNGLLIEEEDPKDIAEKVIEIFQRPVLAAALARNAEKTALSYDWREVIKKVEKAYLKLIR